MLSRSETAMPKACGGYGADLREFNSDAGHLHPLIRYLPKISVSPTVNTLNCVPARRLRAELIGQVNQASTHGHCCSSSYFAASFGGVPPEHHPPVRRTAAAPGLTAGPG